MKKISCLIGLLCSTITLLFSQVAINNQGAPPAGSAMLDVGSTDMGLLVPRMTAAQRDAISEPATGLLIFCLDDNQFYHNSGTPATPVWTSLKSQWESTNDNIYFTVGRVGIGTTNPATDMEISTLLRLTPSLSTETCDGSMQGSIYYDSHYNKFCYCNGTHWMMLDGSGYCECQDIDGDNYDDCDPSNPYDTDGFAADCNDNDPAIHPGAAELCDGIDNDCDPNTPDGSGEPLLGSACDGADGDLCEEGVFVCSGGVLVCSDITADNLDICDGLDNDCDPTSPDGSEDPLIGSPCDGPDSDLCMEGVYVCQGGTLVCSDNTGDSFEICDGIDNDCNGLVDEGTLCGSYPNMTSYCQGGYCQYSCDPDYYDCNQDISDGCETYVTNLPVFYLDLDGDGYGHDSYTIQACTAPPGYVSIGGDCDDDNPDVNPGATEICSDGIDNDCDGYVDGDDPDCN